MVIPDFINGLFEVSGGLFVLLNIKQILKDKAVQGMHWLPILFFTIWGYWNLYYYHNLHQIASQIGSAVTSLANTSYLLLIFKYLKHEGD